MTQSILKTILFLTFGCSTLFTLIALIGGFISPSNVFYLLLLIPFTVFLGPMTILTLLYSFIYKRNPEDQSKPKRIMNFISLTFLAIIIWFLVELIDRRSISKWTVEFIKESITRSEMKIGVFVFIPICILTSYMFDKFYKQFK